MQRRFGLLDAIGTIMLLGACSADASGNVTTGASAARWHVDVDGPQGGDGTSWALAARDRGAVLVKARAGDEIWVASGTYRPAPIGGPRNARFALLPDVALFGGFVGGESALSERDPLRNVTVLDGDLAGDDGHDDAHGFTNRADNVYQVVVATDAHGAVLDGFTVCGGYADGPGFGATPDSREQGSAINIYFGAITVRGCTLREN